MTRSTRLIYKSHNEHVFDVLRNNSINYDIYMHTWQAENMIWNKISKSPVDYEEYKLLNPMEYKLDSQSDFLNSLNFSRDYYYNTPEKKEFWYDYLVRNMLCGLQSQYRVTKMCIASNKTYDFVIHLRPDAIVNNHLPIDILYNMTFKDIAITNFDHFGGYNDRFAIVPFKMCLFYGGRFDELKSYRKNVGSIVSEAYAKYIIDKYFKVNFIDFNFNLKRPP